MLKKQLFFYLNQPLNVEASNVVSYIRHAQTVAYTTGHKIQFSLSNDGENYLINCLAKDCPKNLNEKIRKGWNVNVSGGILNFDSLGQPVDANGSKIGAPMQFTLRRESEHAIIEIQPLTGYAKILSSAQEK